MDNKKATQQNKASFDFTPFLPGAPPHAPSALRLPVHDPWASHDAPAPMTSAGPSRLNEIELRHSDASRHPPLTPLPPGFWPSGGWQSPSTLPGAPPSPVRTCSVCCLGASWSIGAWARDTNGSLVSFDTDVGGGSWLGSAPSRCRHPCKQPWPWRAWPGRLWSSEGALQVGWEEQERGLEVTLC